MQKSRAERWSRQRGRGKCVGEHKEKCNQWQTTRCLASPTSRSVWKCRSIYVCTLAHHLYHIPNMDQLQQYSKNTGTLPNRIIVQDFICIDMGTKFSCRAQTDLCARIVSLHLGLAVGFSCWKKRLWLWKGVTMRTWLKCKSFFPLICYGDMLLKCCDEWVRGCQKDISVWFVQYDFIHLWMCTTVQTLEVSNIILAFNIFRKYAFNWSKVTGKTLT